MSNSDSNASKRHILTNLGIVGVVVGLAVGAWGFIGFAGGVMGSNDGAPMGRYLAMFAIGALLLVVGLGALSLGTLRAQSNYVAAETADAVRVSAAAVGEGLEVNQGGLLCRQCGHRETPESKFCSSCGTAI